MREGKKEIRKRDLPLQSRLFEFTDPDLSYVLSLKLPRAGCGLEELEDDQIESLKDKLTIKYKHKIEIENVIDPTIVGGMRLIVNNEIMDYSLKSQLNNLKSYILKQT